MNTKVSVVIPVYNGETFIARAVESVLNQSLKPFELIVVNDGSKDGTAEKLATFGNRISVITIPNGGVANARNIGIKASQGELIAFLDADDIWYEDKLKIQLEVFNKYPDVGFTCCDYAFSIGSDGSIYNHFSRFSNDEDIVLDVPLDAPLEALIKRNFVGTCSNVVVKKSVLDQVGLFDVLYKQAEDYDLWLRCALATQFFLLSAVLLEKKSHDENLTNDFLETLLFHEKVLIKLNSNNLAKASLAKIKDKYARALALTRYEIGNLFYEVNQKTKAFEYFFLGLRTSWAPHNIKVFIYYFSRKLLRTLSFGLLKKNAT